MENTPKGKERRSEPRHEISIDVKVMIIGKTLFGIATDISGGGMEIQINKEVKPNTNLAISMQLDREITFKGKVIWTLGDYANGQWTYRVGIQTEVIHFKNAEVISQQEKRQLVRELLPAIRERETGANDTSRIQNVA